MDLIHHPKAAYHPLVPSWLLPALLGLGWRGIARSNSDKGKHKVLFGFGSAQILLSPKPPGTGSAQRAGCSLSSLPPFPKESFGSSRKRILG